MSKKAVFIILGIVCAFVLLEAGLRIGGLIAVSVQEARNRRAVAQTNTYRILCLGESTTAGQYPPFLEEILNRSRAGVRFDVIDKGLGGARTSAIISKLNSNLAQYHPDMVIAMMGINDQQILYYKDAPFAHSSLFQHLRAYRLLLLLCNRFLEKLQAAVKPRMRMVPSHANARAYVSLGQLCAQRGNFFQAEEAFKKALALDPQDDMAYVGLGQLYQDERQLAQTEEAFQKAIALEPQEYRVCQGLGRSYLTSCQLSRSEDAFKKALELNPKNDNAYIGRGWLYWKQGKFLQSEDAFKKALELNPKNDEAHVGLGRLYRSQGKLSGAQEHLNKALELNSQNLEAYFGLGRIYWNQGKLSGAEEAFKKVIALDPQNNSAYLWLGWLYQAQGRTSPAKEAFQKVIELTPHSAYAYARLGWFYRIRGELSHAADAYRRIIALEPHDDRAYGALSVLCDEMGDPAQASAYAQKANEMRLAQCEPVTTYSYRTLKGILDKKGIRLVCVQYPMRSIQPLKKIFQGRQEGVVFVDNERIFRDAVKKDGYLAYFNDMFGGDFGHCTAKGNRLLAERIAEAILKDVFHPSQ